MRVAPVDLEQHPELVLLARVDCLLGHPEAGPPARLHLDQNERLSVFGHDVDLADATAPIASEDAETVLAEVRQGGLLAGTADAVAQRPHRGQLRR